MQDWSGGALQTTTADYFSPLDLQTVLDDPQHKRTPVQRLWLESLKQSIEMLRGRVPWPDGHRKGYGYTDLFRQQERSWWLSTNTSSTSSSSMPMPSTYWRWSRVTQNWLK